MIKRHSLISFLAAFPALVGLALWLAFRLDWLSNSILYLRASLGALALAIGLALTILCEIGVAVYVTLMQQFGRRVAHIQAGEAAKHRQFLRRLDHELKNPLTAMQIEVANLAAEDVSQAETPLPRSSPTAGKSRVLQRLKDQVMRLNDLVIQLRKLGELETHPLEREPIHLDELLADLVREFESGEQGERREIALSLPEIPWPLPRVIGDADLVYLALRNVLGNAAKFSRPGDAIQVRAFEDATQVIVEIADQGPGILEDELPHVWDELYRGNLARGMPGSGLGLPIVKAIIERHGGQATLRSRPDQGTVVTIRLPAAM